MRRGILGLMLWGFILAAPCEAYSTPGLEFRTRVEVDYVQTAADLAVMPPEFAEACLVSGGCTAIVEYSPYGWVSESSLSYPDQVLHWYYFPPGAIQLELRAGAATWKLDQWGIGASEVLYDQYHFGMEWRLSLNAFGSQSGPGLSTSGSAASSALVVFANSESSADVDWWSLAPEQPIPATSKNFVLPLDPIRTISLTHESGQIYDFRLGSATGSRVSPPAAEFMEIAHIPGADSARAVSWGERTTGGQRLAYVTRSLGNALFVVDADSAKMLPASLSDPGDGYASLWFDPDGNGLMDLYVVNRDQPSSFYYQYEQGEFVAASLGVPYRSGSRTVEAADFDMDGDLDLLFTHIDGSPDRLMVNEGSFEWVDATPQSLSGPSNSVASAVADFNRDQRPDIFVVRRNEPCVLVENLGGGSWSDATTSVLEGEGNGTSAVWGDCNNDGAFDLLVGQSNGPPILYVGDGAGAFEVSSGFAPPGADATSNVRFLDYDNDGLLDIFFTAADGYDRLFWNGSSSFLDLSEEPLSTFGNFAGSAWADVDGDGRLDAMQASFLDGVSGRVLRNLTATDNHWLEVDLFGSSGNKFGVGAQITIVAGGVRQIRQVACSAGSKSQDMVTVHFGVGASSTIDSLEVRWPSGVVQTSTGIVGDRRLVVIEDAGSTAIGGIPSSARKFGLDRPAPNPFNPRTSIRFRLASEGYASLRVFDLAGRLVSTLVDGVRAAGEQSVVWEGKDQSGREVASGVYFARLSSDGNSDSCPLVLVR